MAEGAFALPVRFTVNGAGYELEVEARRLLSDVLRHELGLVGTHVGCEQGSCGACTIIWDGSAVRSCLALAVQADGAMLETIEGVASPDGRWHPVQDAMHQSHGLQCGFCTPGIVLSLVASYRSGSTEEEAAGDVLDGHICRCTGYVNIRRAIQAAWRERPE